MNKSLAKIYKLEWLNLHSTPGRLFGELGSRYSQLVTTFVKSK